MSLLDKAKASPARGKGVLPVPDEELDLLIALLKGEVLRIQVAAVTGTKNQNIWSHWAISRIRRAVTNGQLDFVITKDTPRRRSARLKAVEE